MAPPWAPCVPNGAPWAPLGPPWAPMGATWAPIPQIPGQPKCYEGFRSSNFLTSGGKKNLLCVFSEKVAFDTTYNKIKLLKVPWSVSRHVDGRWRLISLVNTNESETDLQKHLVMFSFQYKFCISAERCINDYFQDFQWNLLPQWSAHPPRCAGVCGGCAKAFLDKAFFRYNIVGINGKDHPVTSYISHFGPGTHFLDYSYIFPKWPQNGPTFSSFSDLPTNKKTGPQRKKHAPLHIRFLSNSVFLYYICNHLFTFWTKPTFLT